MQINRNTLQCNTVPYPETSPSDEIRKPKSNGQGNMENGGFRRWGFGENQEKCKGSGSVGVVVGEVMS